MIPPAARVRLAAGVTVVDSRLVDEVQGGDCRLEGAGAAIAAAADGRTVEEIARLVAARYRVEQARALEDTRRFCSELDALLLLEVRLPLRTVPRRLGDAVRLLASGLLPAWSAARRPLDTASAAAAAWTASRAVLRPAGAAGALAAAAATLPAALLPGYALAVGPAAGLGVAAALLVHEAGHAALLRGVPAFVAVEALSARVVHRRLDARRRARVAAAGPLAATGAGWVVLAVAALTGLGEAVVAALVLLAQPLALTAAAGDGRVACGLS